MPLSIASAFLTSSLLVSQNLYTPVLRESCYQRLGPYQLIRVSCQNVNSILEMAPQPVTKQTVYDDKLQYHIYYDKNGTPVIMIEKPKTLEL